MTAPPTPALALARDALSKAYSFGADPKRAPQGWTIRAAAEALLQKLSDHGAATFHCVCTLDAEGNLAPCKTHAQWAKSIAPPDAIRAEPVAYRWRMPSGYWQYASTREFFGGDGKDAEPVYTAPPSGAALRENGK